MGIAKYHGKRKCLEFFVFVCLCFFFLLFFFLQSSSSSSSSCSSEK